MNGFLLGLILTVFIIFSCNKQTEGLRFESIGETHSGIVFKNQLKYSEDLNTYTFRNFYNGAGVALGDVNNDGLVDIYFAGNQVENALYINRGNFKFQDITHQAGVACQDVWSTGVSMADVNGDGWLDIFVCKSGPDLGGIRHNELFINNKNETFTEQAEAWGVADVSLSLHTAFFDYDRDGDLDFYLLSNSNRSVGIYDLRSGQRDQRDPSGGNKLYQNTGSRFVDVTESAGILASTIGYGLGIAISDVNVDGWPDIFISNDFFEKDYLYINTGNGTFAESVDKSMAEISLGSMGADIADVNNDGLPDVFVTDMLPDSWPDKKTKVSFETYDKFLENFANGYHRQFNRNMLHVNQGPKPNEKDFFFIDVGRYANVSATNWSWGSLVADFDNDGNKDLFVASGIPKDLLDQDYINYTAPAIIQSPSFKTDRSSIIKLIEAMPSSVSHNYLYRNSGNLLFDEVSKSAGLLDIGYSNGASYADLDNDGLLDLVINRINDSPLIYRNASTNTGKYLQVQLYDSLNKFPIGARVVAYTKTTPHTVELFSNHGYCSSSAGVINIGLGPETTVVDSLLVFWPTGTALTSLKNIPTNQLVTIRQELDVKKVINTLEGTSRLQQVKQLPITLQKYEPFIDFNRDKLLLHNYSSVNPRVAVADVNADGISDIFDFSNTKNLPTFWLSSEGRWVPKQKPFDVLGGSEITGCAFADVSGDGWLDMLITCGGNRWTDGSYQNTNRLFINQRGKEFVESTEYVDVNRATNSFVRSIDFSNDGLNDFVVGQSYQPFSYGQSGHLQLLVNSGKGSLQDVTNAYGFEKSVLGMLTDLQSFDYDKDGDNDFVLCGHWGGIQLFANEKGKFRRVEKFIGSNLLGLWNTIHISDLNGDGRQDLVVGNVGLNSVYLKSSEGNGLIVGDLDSNGSIEQVICELEADQFVPMIMYPDALKQLPSIRKIANNYAAYANMNVKNLFSTNQLEQAKVYKLNEVRSLILYNLPTGFEIQYLPMEAQWSSIYAIQTIKTNSDALPDLLVGGNNFVAKPEIGGQYGLTGLVLKNLGANKFKCLSSYESGVYLLDEWRSIQPVKTYDGERLLVLGNNTWQTYKLN